MIKDYITADERVNMNPNDAFKEITKLAARQSKDRQSEQKAFLKWIQRNVKDEVKYEAKHG